MKKLFAILMTVAMALSFVAALVVNSSAAVTMVEPTYQYDVGEEFGQMPAVFSDGLWMYEYRMSVGGEFGEFQPMDHYVDTLEDDDEMGSQTKCYIPYQSARKDTNDPANYCMFRATGKQIHPGSGADPALTFVVPAGGTISYELSIHMTGTGATGDSLAVYLNDKMVWPANSEEMYLMLPDASNTPTEVKIDTLKVKAGDKVRFVINANGNKGGKATALDMMPLVTYLTAEVPIHNFFPPDPITATPTSDTCVVSWAPSANAVSYNVYLNDEKQNTEPVVGEEGAATISFTITGLEPSKSYLGLSVTAVNAQGEESEKSTGVGFRTKKAEAVVTTTGDTTEPIGDTNSDSDTPATTSSKTVAPKTEKKSNTGLIIGIICGIVALAAIAVVVILVLKKKGAAASEETAATEDAPSDENK